MERLEKTSADFQGLSPAIDPRRIQQPHIIDARNVLIDGDGPKSYFGSEFFSYQKLANAKFTKSVRIDQRSFILGAEGIFEFNNTEFVYDILYEFAATITNSHPWSTAFVGNKYYFAHPQAGLIEFNPLTETFTEITGPLVPNTIYGITESNGRLIILSEDTVQWSALDSGTDLTPSLATGAGAQGLAIIGGTGIRVAAVVTGFLTFTSQGILKSEFNNSAAVYSHRPLTIDQTLLTPHSLIEIEPDTAVFLSRTGLWTTRGDAPKEYAPLMSEYFRQSLVTQFDTSIKDIFRLDYSRDLQILFLSIGSESEPNVYPQTYANYLPIQDKWGVFNEKHTGFLDVYVPSGPFRGFNFGYMCPGGYIHLFADYPFIEQICSSDDQYDALWPAVYEIDTVINDGVYIGQSRAVASTVDPVSYGDLKTGQYLLGVAQFEEASAISFDADPASYYDSSTLIAGTIAFSGSIMVDQTASPLEKTLGALNSFAIFGLFQFERQQEVDEESALSSLQIDTETVVDDSEVIDRNTSLEADEDYNALADSFEDWGYNITTGTDYGAYLRTTNDGTQLTEFGEETLSIMKKFENSIIFDPMGISGMYHAVRLTASEVGHSFHLKLLKASGMLTGRFQE